MLQDSLNERLVQTPPVADRPEKTAAVDAGAATHGEGEET